MSHLAPPPSAPDLTKPAREGLPPAQRREAMAAVLAGVALATLDTAIANTALPTIAADLGVDPADSVWIVNAYQLAVVATLLPIAAFGEIVGLRRVYLAGLALFTLASLVCALAWSLPALVAARVLQGVGASALMAVNVALIRFIYPTHELGRGLGLNAFVVGVGFALGPTVASLILVAAPWPWLFAVNLPIGLAALALARRALPETAQAGHAFDRIGALLNAATFALFVLGLGEAAHAGPLWRVLAEFGGRSPAASCCCAARPTIRPRCSPPTCSGARSSRSRRRPRSAPSPRRGSPSCRCRSCSSTISGARRSRPAS